MQSPKTLVGALALAFGSLAATAVPTAHAITFELLDATGNVTGVYNPAESAWQIAPGSRSRDLSALPGGGFSILLDPDSFGIGELSTQRSDIYGAGILLPASAHGYRVSFSANLRTWDSYNDENTGVPPFPDGSLGFWDLFAVNANITGYYWNLVSTVTDGEGGGEEVPTLAASTLINDSVVPTPPAGSLVQYTNPGDNPSALPGATWAWGGRDYAAGYFESIGTSGSVVLPSSAPVYVSFVLDTRTEPFADTDYPSWGAFGSAGTLVAVPDGENGLRPGVEAGNPLLPVDGDVEDGVFEFAPFEIVEGGLGDTSFLFIDPDVTIGYLYKVSGGPNFIEILLPTLDDPDGYEVQLLVSGDWVTVGNVDDGGTFTFASGVNTFRVMGISPALGLDPTNPIAFVTGVKFDDIGTVQLEMQAISVPIPEPESMALLAAGLVLVAVRRVRARR